MYQYVFIQATASGLWVHIFQDLEAASNVQVIKKVLPFPNKIKGLLLDGATRFINVKFYQICYDIIVSLVNPLKKISIGKERTYILFQNVSAREFTVNYIKRFLIKHPNCIPVMLFVDPVSHYLSRYAKKITEEIPEFICMTYDPNDAKQHNYHNTMSFYSASDIKNREPNWDIYFSFSGTKRLEMVQNLANHFIDKQINSKIIIAGEPALEQYIKESTIGIEFLKSRKNYKEILDDVSYSNCLLEILQEGHSGATLRYYEAVCFNKKLLTNNKNIVNLPFYNPEYMKYFESLEDIDYEWIKRRDRVSYGYDGRFSPINLLDEIKNISV